LSAQFLGAQPLCFFTTFVGIILAMLGRLELFLPADFLS
jgi:hypothetical protein